ncbi:MAG: TRAP transporter large permease [Geminicoccaceae bacterium]|jgi:tripartite ATP-independent transporter DctM subunit|nr:TRAP transporter large permease [Geminicoccaceae bacterium]HRY25634.1 TRAP transporter large permease [Geminicoccaceae bacterium]
MSLAAVLMFAAFFAGAAIGVPIGHAMIATGFLYLWVHGGDMGLVATQGLNGLFKSFVLLAVPMFIFAAEIMNYPAISDRLLKFTTLLVGRFRGGLAHVNVVLSVIFSGMSGSALADAAGPGKLMISLMTKENRYSPGFAGAVTAASATIGPIIPPSIPMVLYAVVADTSIGYLFMAGIIPGLMMAASLMVLIHVMATRRSFPTEPPIPRSEIVGTVREALPTLMLPVILLGGIYSGAVTPTEAAAVAAGYALLLAAGLYRALSPKELFGVLVRSSRATAIVAVTIIGALFFNYVVAAEGVAEHVANSIAALGLSPLAFLLVINLLFLLLGCFLDTLLMLLIVVPIVMPSVRALGIDTVHFGVVVVVNMMIGLITPPYGQMLFLISGVSGIRLQAMLREIWPFIGALLVALLLMTMLPDVVLLLPRYFGYPG